MDKVKWFSLVGNKLLPENGGFQKSGGGHGGGFEHGEDEDEFG